MKKNIALFTVGLAISCLSLLISFSEREEYRGIANAYPHDVGIAKDKDVLYVEQFKGEIPDILRRYDDVKNSEGMSLDHSDIPLGAREVNALVMTNIGGQNDGGHLFKKFEKGFDGTVYMRYYVKYPSSSKGYIHHESVWIGGYNPALNYPNPRAGICDLGDKRLSIAYEPVNAPHMDTYIYWGDMKNGARSKCYGNDFVNGSPSARQLKWDEWMCVEIMIKLNSPVKAYNGELKVWQDGKLVGHWGPGFPRGYWDADSWINNRAYPAFEGFRWRTDSRLNINHIWIEFYDDTTPPGESHHIKYSNLVIATKYIGPIKK